MRLDTALHRGVWPGTPRRCSQARLDLTHPAKQAPSAEGRYPLSPEGALCAGSRVSLLGTLYAGPQHTTTGEIVIVDVPTDTKPIAVGSIPNNLGYVIQASELLALEEAVREALEPRPVVPRNSPCACGSGKRFKDCCGTLG